MASVKNTAATTLLERSRSSDLVAWHRFEEAGEQAQRLGCRGRAFWVYVVGLENHPDTGASDADAVWIGHTHLDPVERLEQHRQGYRADTRVASYGTDLLPALYADQPQLRTRQEADAYLQLMTARLVAQGYLVFTS